jgi:hypothetical protein
MWSIHLGSVNIVPYLIMAGGYVFTILTSGYVFRLFIGSSGAKVEEDREEETGDDLVKETLPDGKKWFGRLDVGVIIGKCENILALTMILNSEYTGLAIIFTAKSIIRLDAMKKNPKYYLGGTLVNLCYTILMGYVIRFLLALTGFYL